MKVFVTGGTGAIGGYAVPALVRAGHAVSALTRGPEKAAELAEQGASPVPVSLFDSSALAAAFSGHDVVVNLATAMPATSRFVIRRAWRATECVRSEGSAAVADAALAAGVDRVVQESVAMLYRDGGNTWVDEDAPVDRYPATAGNHAAEASAHRFAEAGGTAIVLRFGLIYGRGARHSEQMFTMARRHLGVVLGSPGSYLSSVHLADAATAVAASLHAPAGTFNVVDDEPLTKRDYADALSAAAGTTPWVRVPGRAGLIFGDRLTSLTRSLRVSNSRFRTATGWEPRYPSARQGWVATAGELARGL
ncbi:MAG: NAD-dependent epimerase/dehydratase family protein [Nocardioidaceae bacterium]